MGIRDGRTLVTAADSTTNWSLIGTASGPTLESDTVIEGSNSVACAISSAGVRAGLQYALPFGEDWTDFVLYIYCQFAAPASISTTAGDGIHFWMSTGGTAITTLLVDSSVTYKGGWKQYVVDVQFANDHGVWTVGGADIANITDIGMVVDNAVMNIMQDNFFIDAIWVMDKSKTGIIVEGDNNGIPYAWADILSASVAESWGTCVDDNGVFTINTPVAFGSLTGQHHDFQDSNQLITWSDEQFIATGFYKMSVINGTGTHEFSLGTTLGSGIDEIGVQGCVITAADDGHRWDFIASGQNIYDANLNGCVINHLDRLEVDNTGITIISTIISDTQSGLISNCDFRKNTIINAATADGVALFDTNAPNNVGYNNFVFSDGHALEILETGEFNLVGNTFTNYGASGSNDAAIYNNSGGVLTLNVSGGVTSPTVRNGASASTNINNNVVITLTGLEDNTEVRICVAGTTTEVAGTENATDGSPGDRSFSWSDSPSDTVDIIIHNLDYVYQRINGYVIPSIDTEVPVQQVTDRNYENP